MIYPWRAPLTPESKAQDTHQSLQIIRIGAEEKNIRNYNVNQSIVH